MNMPFPATIETKQLAHKIWRAHLMFRAYKHDLSQRGQELALLTNKASDRISAGDCLAKEVQKVEMEVLANLPDTAGTNLLDASERSWLNWFDLGKKISRLDISEPMGDGCLEPCSFCERGNSSGWTSDKPLYVIASIIRNYYEDRPRAGGAPSLFYQGVFGNNVIEWLDPFFHFDIASLAASLAMLDGKITFAPIVKAFNPDDLRTLDAVRRLGSINRPDYTNSLILSFHLGIGSPEYDLIKSVAAAGGKKIPNEIIDRYAARYAANFMEMAPRRIFIYGLGLGIRAGELQANFASDWNDSTAVFNWATRQTYIRALALAGIDIHETPFAIAALDRRPLHYGGRGFDFLRRYDRAFYQGEFLEADKNCATDLAEKQTPYTKVKRRGDGTVLVTNPSVPEEVLVRTTLDELWPMTV